MRYRFIHEHRGVWPIGVQCRVLQVSRSGYYAWQTRPDSRTARRRAELTDRIREIHQRPHHANYNAPTESLIATLKKELVQQQHYATRAAARRSLFEYIEVFYNRQRRHSALDYQTPDAHFLWGSPVCRYAPRLLPPLLDARLLRKACVTPTCVRAHGWVEHLVTSP